MPSSISGTQIATANLLLGGTYLADTISTIDSKASNNYLIGTFSSNNYLIGTFSSNNYLIGTFSSNNYLQAQGYGTGDVSNNYLQSQLGGSTFTGAAGVFSDFSGNSTLALRNSFSTSTDYNVGSFTVATTGITVPSDGYYDCYVNLYMTSSATRPNIGLRFYIDTTVQDPISASDYIRNTSGHNEASTNLRMILYMTAGQAFRIGTQQLAAAGTVTIAGASSNWIIQKVG
jgi:hypothetical protein